MSKRKILSSALLLLITAQLFAGCSKDNPDKPEISETQTATQTSSAQTTEEAAPALDGISFNGADFTVLHYYLDVADYTTLLFADGENGDIMNDAVYGRARAVE